MGSGPEQEHRQFVIDFYGAMAYGELSAFERFSADARFSPTLHDRITIGKLAAEEFAHFELVSAELADLGADVEAAMEPFQAFVDAFHERTRPADWYEALMKAYVSDAVSGDFYRAVAVSLDPPSRALVSRIKADTGQAEVLRVRLAQALSGDARLASRLALWGRRLVGEALTQAQRVTFEHQFLGALLRRTDPASRKAATDALFARLTGNHSRRMNDLGLTA
ncbi:ferritin-like domain-containing protein [Arthrobacter sp. I2-34]|uniref:Ferritin-like domain-containing protein n=1 Tax=Arthrobacter hankyongi TaxID=2904801 RepID=A0ABS9L887_9MICC|nr:ferritin-like fold-containing protein [Arthrobacter hankyongi]MCG2622798.1 ferritin-like domain-containing protein [Arthrobacter hankyongi]